MNSLWKCLSQAAGFSIQSALFVFILSPLASAAKAFCRAKSQHFEWNVKSFVMDLFSRLDVALNKNWLILFQQNGDMHFNMNPSAYQAL